MDNSKKRSPWQIANATVLLLHLAFPVWLVAWMYTPAISSILLPVMMICGLLPGVCSKLVKKFQKGKGLLIASRVLAVFAIAAFYTPLVVLRSAEEVQLLYPSSAFCIHTVCMEIKAAYMKPCCRSSFRMPAQGIGSAPRAA